MKKISILILILFLAQNNIYASFIYQKPSTILKESDVIVVVRVIGEKATVNQRNVPEARDGIRRFTADTLWDVEIYKYIKDNTRGRAIEIATEGASAATSHLSTDFSLKEYGEYMILCLEEKETRLFYPRSPQSIIPLKTIYRDDVSKTLQINNINDVITEDKEYEEFLFALKELEIQRQKDGPQYLFIRPNGGGYNAEGMIREGRTYIGIRDLSHILAVNCKWNEKTKKIEIHNLNTVVELSIGNRVAKVNGIDVKIDYSPIIEDGQSYLPVRILAEIFEIDISYHKDGDFRTYSIVKKYD